MKILIINPPFYRLQGASLVHYPPGCCYMAASLQKAGFDSLIYNADYDPRKKTILGNTNHINVKALTEQNRQYLSRLNNDADPLWREIREYLKRSNPGLLIISVFSTTLTAGIKIARMSREINPAVKIAFEGWTNRGLHCAVDPAVCGDFTVMDFAIRKEPEATVAELAAALDGRQTDLGGILGLSWKKTDGRIVHNPDRPFLETLDALPFPARDHLDGWRKMPAHCFQGIYGSRGCPFDCVFCGGHTSMGHKPRVRSAQNMVDEIEQVHKKFGTRYFYVCDDIFFLYKSRAHEFCRLLKERGLPVYWSAQTRAEIVDLETLKLMKWAGGQHVAVGVEVGNPHIRQLIKKGNTVEDVRRCSDLIKQAGLRMVAFCMVGLPWEGAKEIQDTVDLVKEIDPYIVYPYMPTPAVGTELAEIMAKKNPQGLRAYRDRCHIDTSAVLSEHIDNDEKKAVIDRAMATFVALNRRNLVKDVFKRPLFYLALAQDMGFLVNPRFFLSYLKDYAGA